MDKRAAGRDNLSDLEFAYLAGIIDGEGTIGIYKGGGPYSYHLRLIVTNTCFPLMEWVHVRIGGSFIPTHRIAQRHAQGWQIVLFQRRAARVISGCLPYLVVKQQQARLGLEFVDSFVSFQSSGRVPHELEIARRLKMYEASLSLNHGNRNTGRRPSSGEQLLPPPGASTLPPFPE